MQTRRHILLVTVLLGLLGLQACDVFGPDGTTSDSLTRAEGFFYMMDRSTSTLYQLDGQLREVNNWDLSDYTDGNLVQGITFDGSHIWISIASGINRLYKLDLTFDQAQIIQAITAPPSGRGTIRDITFDGTHLWAANSGSVSATEQPAMYKLDPETGEVLDAYPMPTTEIRSVAYIPPNGDEYGRGTVSGIYLGDREANKFWNFRFDRITFSDAFDAPIPPEGQFRVFPSGLTYEQYESGEIKFWSVNSSLGANYLFRINRLGQVDQRFELRHYGQPGPIVYTITDVSVPAPPDVEAIVPNRGAWNTVFDVEVSGSGFREGEELALDMGSGIEVSGVSVVSAGLIRASVSVTASATTGLRDITVVSGDGQTATLAQSFDVTEEPPKFGYIYIGDFGNQNLIYRIREADGGLEQQWSYADIAPGGSLQGAAHDGEHLWIAAAGSDRTLFQLDTSTDQLEVIRSIPAPYPTGTGTVRDMKFHNGSLWAANSGDNKIYELNPADGDILSEIDTPGADTRAITFADDVLYAAERGDGNLYAYDSATGDWSVVFQIPLPSGASSADRLPVGIDWDGTHFWIAITRLSNDYIMQVAPDGTLVREFASPNAGPDILSGLVFVLE